MPIDLTEGSAERDAFYFKFSGKSPAQIKAYWSKVFLPAAANRRGKYRTTAK